MRERDRQEVIVDLLEHRPFMTVRELQDEIGVSAATIRRNIDKMDAAGRVKKVHGGVASLGYGDGMARSLAQPFVENRDIHVLEKQAIAEAAAALVRDGSIILVHGGSTCFHFGRHVANRNIRVITNSMPLAAYLSEHGTCQLTVGGGDLYREPGILFDPNVRQRNYFAAQFFVGALGVSDRGLLEANPLLVRHTREMGAIATETIVLVDSHKFDARPPTVALGFDKVDRLVTDAGLSDRHVRMLEDAGVEVIVADLKGRKDG
ncbi:DeoR/GlpR family DNA-binding transcription regulator [Tropicimonas sp. IMCC34043]|uniref:DeoR/GlpR family DNA-binding transcription regulator n=1 Tax=Tropicimonas sp. IMCC34043 TaxID=2248760 RepID=UPI000E26B928|nr:DeoR/GlpR family DNA-binding transcription regulator [Tropicimonas sp. IMCC34043]